MKNVKSIVAFALAGIFLASCANTNNVVSNRLISKRKYTKGFFIKKRGVDQTSSLDQLAKFDKDQTGATIDQNLASTNFTDVKNEPTSAVQNENHVASVEFKPEEKAMNKPVNSSTVHTDKKQSFIKTNPIAEAGSQLNKLNKQREESSKVSAQSSPDTSDPVMLILLIILALILPPLAIVIYEGATGMFWIDLILFLIGIGGFFFIPGISWAASLAAVIIAFLVIFDVI